MICGSRLSRTWRHNSLRDLLAKAIESVGLQIGYEHNGGLPDNRRPGDIIVYNWNGDKHLLIDVSVTNSLAAHNRSALLKNGPGGGAAATERTKRAKYKDIDSSEYTYLPFVLETCGAFGEPALQLCKTLRKLWMTKCCSGKYSPNFNLLHRSYQQHQTIDPLLVSISVLLQTHNGQMILERTPLSPKLLDSEIVRSQARSNTHKEWATERLHVLDRGDKATLRRFSLAVKKVPAGTRGQGLGKVQSIEDQPTQLHGRPTAQAASHPTNITTSTCPFPKHTLGEKQRISQNGFSNNSHITQPNSRPRHPNDNSTPTQYPH